MISVYEKGRISSKKIWRRRYVNSLKSSICVMNLLVSIIKSNKKLTDVEFKGLDNYFNNRVKILPSGVYEKIFEAYQSGILFQFEVDKVGYEFLDLMEINLEKCSDLLSKKSKNYKTKVFYLLQAIHNIPRYFFAKGRDSFFGISISDIDVDCIRDSVYDYMRLSEKC